MRCGLLAALDTGLWHALSAAPMPKAVKPVKKPRRAALGWSGQAQVERSRVMGQPLELSPQANSINVKVSQGKPRVQRPTTLHACDSTSLHSGIR